MPLFEQHLASWQLTDRVPETVSIGRDTAGNFCTSRLKEYPPGLCRAMSWSICAHLAAHRTEDLTISCTFRQRCKAMQVGFSDYLGADFAAG